MVCVFENAPEFFGGLPLRTPDGCSDVGVNHKNAIQRRQPSKKMYRIKKNNWRHSIREEEELVMNG